MSKTIEDRIECPFYLKEGTKTIVCEGVIKNTRCVNEFRSEAEKIQYENSVCSSDCGKKCYHYRNLSLLYERGILG